MFMMIGAVLTAVGAIKVAQVIHSVSSHCLRRLQKLDDRAGLSVKRGSDDISSGEESIIVVSEAENVACEPMEQKTKPSTSAKKRATRSGLQKQSGAGAMSQSSSLTKGMSSQSGLRGRGSSSSSSLPSSNVPAAAPMTGSMPTTSGLASGAASSETAAGEREISGVGRDANDIGPCIWRCIF
eukprot:s281_g31.t1